MNRRPLEFYTDPSSGIIYSYKKVIEPQTWKTIHAGYMDLRHPENNRPIRQMTLPEMLRNFDKLQTAHKGMFHCQCGPGTGIAGNTLVLNVPTNKLGLKVGIYVFDAPNSEIVDQFDKDEQGPLAILTEKMQKKLQGAKRLDGIRKFAHEGMEVRYARTSGEGDVFYYDGPLRDGFAQEIYCAITDGFQEMKKIFPHNIEGWLDVKEGGQLSIQIPWFTRTIMPPVQMYHNRFYVTNQDAKGFFSYGIGKSAN